jgi:hypothetical protein
MAAAEYRNSIQGTGEDLSSKFPPRALLEGDDLFAPAALATRHHRRSSCSPPPPGAPFFLAGIADR